MGRPDATQTPPDWERIPFEVPCPGCAENLHGTADSLCPHCCVSFEWGAVLPIDELRCSQCNYRVFGLTEPRCPECGQSFAWKDALDAARIPKHLTFEHRWIDEPVPALARTWWLAAVRPNRLWAMHDPMDRPKVAPLLLFMFIQWAVFAFSWTGVGFLADEGVNELARLLDRPAGFSYQFRLGAEFFKLTGAWYVITFLCMQMFVLSKERYGARWKQILRVYVHATAFASLCMLISILLEIAVDLSVVFIPALRGLPFVIYDRLQRGVLLLGVVVTWVHIWIGYHRHLKIPRAWGTSAMCLVLGYLLSGAIP